MSEMMLDAWLFDPAFSSPELPSGWQSSIDPNGEQGATSGPAIDLSTFMQIVTISDVNADGLVSGGDPDGPNPVDTFTVNGAIYAITSVFNGDTAVIDGVSYTLVTFYGFSDGVFGVISLPMIDGQIAQAFAGAVSATTYITSPNDVALPIKSIPCFLRGTRIETDRGTVPVELLAAGDLVKTLDAGLQPILWVGSTPICRAELLQAPQLRPVRIRAGALSPGSPQADLLVSPQHRVLIRSAIVQRMFGVPDVLIAARHLLGLDGVETVQEDEPLEYFHLLMSCHQILYSEGAATESLFVGPHALAALPPLARQQIGALMGARTPDPARLLVPGARARGLIRRHQRNGVALMDDPGMAPDMPAQWAKTRPMHAQRFPLS